MNWLYYLLEANIYLSIFYALYYFLLKKETLYTMNRVYLLSTCLLSFIIPLVQIGMLKPVHAVIQGDLLLTSTTRFATVSVTAQPVTPAIDFQTLLLFGYLLGAGLLTVGLIIKLTKLFSLARTHKDEITANYKLIYLDNSDTAFSFFSYLFVGAGANGKQTIIRHELVHIEQKHSVDIFLLELIKIVSWFNPFIYLLQNSLKEIHEFIADEKTAAYDNDPLTYANFLVNNAYGVGGSSITHSFFNYNLLKKRIIMLHQKRSGTLARLKYLLALPVCAALLCASTLGFSKNYGFVDLAPGKSSVKTLSAPSVVSGDSTATMRRNFTKKGYKFQEDGYLINNKANFRVIITDKGVEKEYFRNSVTPAELKMLHEKYGYEFPTMNIFPKLPPPPPMPPAPKAIIKRPPPPPPAAPAPKANIKLPPPPPPAPPVDVKQGAVLPKAANEPIAEKSENARVSAPVNKNVESIFRGKSNLIYEGKDQRLIVINDVIYNPDKPIKKGQQIYTYATDSTVVYIPDSRVAINKWGERAKYGVLALYGQVSVNVK